MKRFSWGLVAASLAVALFAGTADAQQRGQGGRGRGGFGFGGMSVISLATNEAVQKEIGADEATVGKIKAVSEEYNSALPPFDFQGLQNLSDDERRAKFRELTEKRTEVTKTFEPKLKDAVTADQYKRLKEIHVQAMGVGALKNADIAKDLGVSDEQAKKIADVQMEYGQKRRDLGRDATPEARRELGQAETKAVTAVLTSEQQEKFAAMKGKEFDLSQVRPGRPGGQGRPGGANRTRRPKTE